MPQSGQIVPEHLFPHEMVVINDNTAYVDELTVASDDSNKLLFVFSSPKGEDNKIKTIRGGLQEFVDTYGVGPFSLYGQPYLNAYSAFESGAIVGHCLRVAAENAAYSYAVVVALFKADGGANTLSVKFKVKKGKAPLTDIHKLDQIYVPSESPLTTGPDVDASDEGFTEVKLFTVRSKGRGEFGNKFAFNIISDSGSDKDNEYKNYFFSVFEYDNQLRRKGMFPVVFNDEAVVFGDSLYVDGVVNARDGSEHLYIKTNLDAFKKLYDEFKKVKADSPVPYEEFDFFFGVDKNTGEAVEGYKILSTDKDVINIADPAGIYLVGGDDGDLATTKEASARQTSLDALYLKAFSAQEPFDLIASKNKYPTHLILDANYKKETKEAIIALTKRRNDCMCVIDMGTELHKKSSVMAYLKAHLKDAAVGTKVMIDAYAGKARDPYSKKIVTCTSTYALAKMYPLAWRRNGGKHVPVAGNTRGIIEGFIEDTIYPIFDEDIDATAMNELAENNINFARINARQDIIRATQATRNPVKSVLSEASNVFVLNDIARDVKELCASYQYNFNEESDIALFNTDVETITAKYDGSQVRRIKAQFSKNEWEAKRGILHLRVDFAHKDLVKTTIIEIDVSR